MMKIFTIAIAISLTSGCATNNLAEDLKSGLTTVGSKVSSGFQSLKNRTSTTGNRPTNDETLKIVAKFPSDEVPHTLLKKPLANGILTSGHGYRLSPTGIPLPRKHKGVDYAADTGTSIYAAGDGTIDKLYVSTSYGKYIRIKHKNGFSTAYAHMDSFADGLKTGSTVTKGQTIGTVGSTGRSSAPHLHMELLYGSKFLDPLFKTPAPADSQAENSGETVSSNNI